MKTFKLFLWTSAFLMISVGLNAQPARPTLLSPPDGAIRQLTSPTLSWSMSTGASTYRLQVSPNSTFNTTVLDDSSITMTSRQVVSAPE